MGHVFRPGLYACDPGGALVFLDIVGDRYFALGGVARRACLNLVEGAPCQPEEQTIIDDLVANDILRCVDGNARPALCANTPCRGAALRDDEAVNVTYGAVAAALARTLAAIVELKIGSLDRILARFVFAKESRSSVKRPLRDPSIIATTFAKADRILTSLDLCLPRSIALARMMMASGHSPSLVLGVKLRPFEAHCWVQQGDILVGDEMATIAPFSPILVL
jgi:Transglutaminase-like superfamily